MKAIPRSPCSSAWKINTFLHVEADTAKGEVGIILSNVLNHSKTLILVNLSGIVPSYPKVVGTTNSDPTERKWDTRTHNLDLFSCSLLDN